MPALNYTVLITDTETLTMAEVTRGLRSHGLATVGPHDVTAQDALLIMAGPVTHIDAAFLARHPQVSAVIRVGAGYDNVDIAALRAAGVALAAADVSGDPSVAEWTVGAMLCLLRDYARADQIARSGDWAARVQMWGHTLRSRRIGIIGYGAIGGQVARLCVAFGAEVVVWHPWSARQLPSGIGRAASLADLLRIADIVSLHCRLEPETRHLIDAAALSEMKRDAILINSGRGELVDEAALAAALTAGHLAGAVVDTVKSEPRPDLSPLASAPRVLLTPHVAAYTQEGRQQLVDWAVNEAQSYLRSRRLSPATEVLPSEDSTAA
jgi:phosphoglycerate dehydrogenase-like enzyme